jgi:exonuclease SbcC
MIPISISISGFLSYRDPVEIDFTTFDLACIAGANGAGKSSILDAITWALFGQARKRDESLINTQSDSAEVILDFNYEGNVYRVQRANPRGKTSILEFSILQTMNSTGKEGKVDPKLASSPASTAIPDTATWKPLTERTLRDTQTCIEETLRLDYDTFINAAFFLQGKADQFTQQRPGDRKRILSSILGLEIWETYRLRTSERRRNLENEIAILDGRLSEINAELGEENARKNRLKELQIELERLSKVRAAQDTNLENIKKITASLEEKRKWVNTLARGLDANKRRMEELQSQFADRQEERHAHAEILAKAHEIETTYAAWQKARADLERWEAIATEFRQHEKQRQAPLTEIETERALLEQELENLEQQKTKVEEQLATLPDLNEELESIQKVLAETQEQIKHRTYLETELQTALKDQAEARAENPRLKSEMDELKNRIDQLSLVERQEQPDQIAVCPTCGQPLSPEERETLVVELSARGKELGDKYRANRRLLTEADQLVASIEAQITDLSHLDEEHREHIRAADQVLSKINQIETQKSEWGEKGEPRLLEISHSLKEQSFAQDARTRLQEIDAELNAIGYDTAAHDEARRVEAEGRMVDEEMRALEKAKATLQPLEREIAGLKEQIVKLEKEISGQEEEYQTAAADLEQAESQAPDLQQAQRDLLDLQEEENRLRLEVGAAQQKVDVLEDLKNRRKVGEESRQELALKVGQHKQLERAFSKDGVPALLIEQALPQIEAKANEILDRLSAGSMSVRFQTQRELKTRDDLRETLDIQISDNAGIRDYEMYSGGEAFRVNFAIRLALSEVLAQRAGARLQTLVIDEGFGSQDAIGRQRLIEAINLVRPDFAKILVITHIEELKEAFPRRIEVEKTARGSVVRVV